MTGFEPRTFVIGSNRSTNWATTTPFVFASLRACHRRRRRQTFRGCSVVNNKTRHSILAVKNNFCLIEAYCQYQDK